jgi:hypothetical protein
METIHWLSAILGALRARMAPSRRDEYGYTLETVIIAAALSAAAIAAVALIVAAIANHAGQIK